jgi:enhancer of polycomb-like protein
MIKRREKTKREQLHLSIEIYEKRYQAKDFSGQLLNELTAAATKSRYFYNFLICSTGIFHFWIYFISDLHLHRFIPINLFQIEQCS